MDTRLLVPSTTDLPGPQQKIKMANLTSSFWPPGPDDFPICRPPGEPELYRLVPNRIYQRLALPSLRVVFELCPPFGGFTPSTLLN